MKRGFKITLIIISVLIVFWVGLRITGLKFYKVSTVPMENTLPVGTRVMVWKKNFQPERFDIIVYHNPDCDTVLVPYNSMDYYAARRQMGAEIINLNFKKKYVPLSDREEWIGRCVGLPGDKVEIKNGKLYINEDIYENGNVKKSYFLKTKGDSRLIDSFFKKSYIKPQKLFMQMDSYTFTATSSQISELLKEVPVDTAYCITKPFHSFDNMIFPYDSAHAWNRDNFGEILIPQKGKELQLSNDNISIYRRMIEAFEGNKLSMQDSQIRINGEITSTYIPKQNYYFICNDNRDNSLDSRYYGFLPEDHISGMILKIFK